MKPLRPIWQLAVLASAALGASPAFAGNVTLSNVALGNGPSIVGFNLGDYYPGSNTTSWWRHAGVNGARIFSSPSLVTPANDFPTTVVSQSDFITKRAALRANPLSSTYINWTDINNLFANATTTNNNAIRLQYAGQQLTGLGVKPLIVMTRSLNDYGWPTSPTSNTTTDWNNRWLGWQQWYAQAHYWARNFNVTAFQMFNEPNHSNANGLTQTQFVEMLQYAQNAIHSAIADVNRDYGKSLVADVHAPATSGGPRLSAGDWGDVSLANRTNTLFGDTSLGNRLFRHYDYHQYDASGGGFGNTLAGALSGIATATGGENIPVSISEFNTRSNANYATSGTTVDTPAEYARLGAISANLANNRADAMYLFKFAQSGGSLNGVHYVSPTSPYNIGGISKSGAVFRLFSEAFTPAADGTPMTLLTPPTTTDTSANLSAALNPTTGYRYIYAANTNTTAGNTLTINLAQWGIPAGTFVTVEQVSSRYHAEVSQSLYVPGDRIINVTQDAGGVVLVRIPSARPTFMKTLAPTHDAMVVSGTSAGVNFSSSTTLVVRNDATVKTQRQVMFLKFSTDGVEPANVMQALLSITASNPGGGSGGTVIAHVYGTTNNSWSENSITWNNAPNLTTPVSVLDSISDNYVTDIGGTADIVGHFTADATQRRLTVDVSDWVMRQAGATSLSFMIVREVRFDGDLDGTQYLSIPSKESADPSLAAQLMLSYSPVSVPEPGSLAALSLGLVPLARRRRVARR